jgi:hypothetical protein
VLKATCDFLKLLKEGRVEKNNIEFPLSFVFHAFSGLKYWSRSLKIN